MVQNVYNSPKTDLVDIDDIILYENNVRERNAILCGLVYSEFTKITHWTSTKEIWDKLKNIYEGDENFKMDKLHTFSVKFERLQMKEWEYIATYFLWLDDIVNCIRGLGANIDEESIGKIILRTLPPIFHSKVYVLEDRANLDKLIKDKIHGIIIAYENMTKKKNPYRK